MRRREFIALTSAAAATVAVFPRIALAQQAAKLPRVAFLYQPLAKYYSDAFFQGLADRGYVDGKNIVVEWFTAPTIADLPAFAAKAVASAPAVIVVGGNSAALAAAEVIKTIPVVFRVNSDPVALGLVSNLAHPGGNFTGAASLGSVTAANLFGFLKEMVPGLSRVAFFGKSADGATDAVQREDVLTAGKATGIDIITIDITNIDDLAPFVAAAVAARAQAAFFGAYADLSAPAPGALGVLNALSAGQKQQPTYNAAYIAGNNNMSGRNAVSYYLALLNRLPVVWGVPAPPGVTGGALLSYGEPTDVTFRRAAHFVADIVQGARPQDLPVELPTKYELQLNLKTAKALGLAVPQSVLFAATEIFE